MAYLKVHVRPGSRQDALLGWQGDVLRLSLKATPERGKANQAACRLLALTLGLPQAHVVLARGATSRHKLLFIDGLSDEELRRRLST